MKKVHISQVFGLWQNYQEIKLRFPAQQSIPVASFSIITACNPRSRLLSDKFNSLRMQKMQRYLNSKKIAHLQVTCGSPDFSWQEPSFALLQPLEPAIRLAKLYEQNAVYYVKNKELWLVPVLISGVEARMMGKLADFL